jgi:hypothetical protein
MQPCGIRFPGSEWVKFRAPGVTVINIHASQKQDILPSDYL